MPSKRNELPPELLIVLSKFIYLEKSLLGAQLVFEGTQFYFKSAFSVARLGSPSRQYFLPYSIWIAVNFKLKHLESNRVKVIR